MYNLLAKVALINDLPFQIHSSLSQLYRSLLTTLHNLSEICTTHEISRGMQQLAKWYQCVTHAHDVQYADVLTV